jgi:ribose transport system permease protein
MNKEQVAKSNAITSWLKVPVKKYEFSLFCAWALICLIMSFLNPYFFTVKNFMNIGLNSSVAGTLAAGLSIYMLMGSMELSQYPCSALCATVMGIMCIYWGWPAWISIICTILFAAICGLFNSSLLVFCRIPPIIVTLGSMNIFRGIAYMLTNARNILLLNAPDAALFKFIGQTRIFGIIPVPLIIMLCMFLLSSYLLKRTEYGRQVYAVGANSRAAHLCGINVRKVRFIGMMISSISSGVAGILSACIVMTAMPAAGVGSEVEITTSVLIGGLAAGRGKPIGVFLGMMILMTINNGMTLMSLSSYYQMTIRGFVLLIAVLVDTVRGGGFSFSK